MLGPLFEAFAELNVMTERVVYEDESIEEVRATLLGLDGSGLGEPDSRRR